MARGKQLFRQADFSAPDLSQAIVSKARWAATNEFDQLVHLRAASIEMSLEEPQNLSNRHSQFLINRY